MKIKNILYIGGFELPDKNAAAHRVINNARLLRELGYSVSFLGMTKDRTGEDINSSKKNYYGFDSWAINYPSTTGEWIKYVTQIISVRQLLDENSFDTVITYNFPAVSSMKLLSLCRKRKITAISDCTEWYDHKISGPTGLIRYVDSELRMKYFNKKYDGLICISSYLYDYYKDLRNRIILPPLTDASEDKYRTVQDSRDKIALVYAGSPGNKDRIFDIIKLLSQINDIEKKITFDIFGTNKIETRAGFVRFNGTAPHSEVIKHISSSDFLIFVREYSRVNNAGFPTKFAEAITCGTPVITNRTSDLEKYLIEVKNGFFLNTENDELMKSQLENIFRTDRTEIDAMKEYCRVSGLFDYRSYSEPVKTFIQKIEECR